MTAPVTYEDVLSWSADLLEGGIVHALRAKEMDAVYALLMLLALKDPDRAEEIRLLIKAGADLADLAGGAS